MGELIKLARKNAVGAIALIFISCMILLAVIGYGITPDDAPYAATQFISQSAASPGTTIQLVEVNAEKNEAFDLLKWYHGNEKNRIQIAVDSFFLVKDSLYYRSIDNSLSGYHQKFDAVLADKTEIKSFTFWLGADTFGRDVLSRLIIGLRITLGVGFGAVIISVLVGTFLGLIAGYFRGKADAIIMYAVNVTWSIPSLLLVIAISLALGKGVSQIFLAVGLTMWVDVARMVRGEVLKIREKEFVEAAVALGFSDTRIMLKHILPNCIAPLSIVAASNFASAILVESGLSFLGLGVAPPIPTLGIMIRENYQFLIAGKPHLALYPGVLIMLLVLAFNIIGLTLSDIVKRR